MDNTSIITQVNKEDEALEVSNSYSHEKRKSLQESMHCTFGWRATYRTRILFEGFRLLRECRWHSIYTTKRPETWQSHDA